ncbi:MULTISPECIES: manganese-binding transcriptional regulator MntR [Sphingomonas]|jgi:DtxR family manganese transport transcriptional regulator|uniref:manganese-binding transcriptional regulator MntR n=1 Tax=Sphingomonas TaxID=13687 RepID=UPI00068B4D3D|nr:MULTISPECIES: manganese-binding transcriptional regulator MntR [Sphingomonas]
MADDTAVRRAAAFRATREAHASEMAEDYVELIGDLIEERGEARVIDLAQHMGVTQPTVAKIIQRLKSLGLVQNRRYRALFLTDAGKALATRSRERHQVVVDFLVALGIDPEIAAIDSEGMEHHVSDATLQAMRGVVMGSSAQDKA